MSRCHNGPLSPCFPPLLYPRQKQNFQVEPTPALKTKHFAEEAGRHGL